MKATLPRSFGVVILGAGASARMGRAKLLLPWRGTSVIGAILAAWQELGAAQIAVVTRPGDAALAAELDRLGFPPANRIANPQPERGMFSSIQCAAAWSGWHDGLSSWAVALGDQPHLRPETLRGLLHAAEQNPAQVCQPILGGHGGHPVILPQAVFAGLPTTTAATLKDFLNLSPARRVCVEGTDPGLLLDMDTPEDYIRLKDADS